MLHSALAKVEDIRFLFTVCGVDICKRVLFPPFLTDHDMIRKAQKIFTARSTQQS